MLSAQMLGFPSSLAPLILLLRGWTGHPPTLECSTYQPISLNLGRLTDV